MKRALVLGGSGAVGAAVCRLLAEQGARVAFTWHQNEAAALALREQLPGGLALRLDARRAADVDGVVAAAARELGGLDAVAHCIASGVRPTSLTLEGATEADWDELLAVNAKSAWLAVRAAAPHLRAAGGGNVVLVGSVDSIKPAPAPVHYAASKAALVGMAQTLAKELGKDQVKVNLVAPGILDGGLARHIPPTLRAEYDKHCGLKRPGRVVEVANLIAWLCLENTYVTAQRLLLDGAL